MAIQGGSRHEGSAPSPTQSPPPVPVRSFAPKSALRQPSRLVCARRYGVSRGKRVAVAVDDRGGGGGGGGRCQQNQQLQTSRPYDASSSERLALVIALLIANETSANAWGSAAGST